jgi:hypothetical protein
MRQPDEWSLWKSGGNSCSKCSNVIIDVRTVRKHWQQRRALYNDSVVFISGERAICTAAMHSGNGGIKAEK